MSAEKLAGELKTILLKRIAADQLVVPTMPAVSQRIAEALREGEAGLRRANDLFGQDPFLAARAYRASPVAKAAAAGKKITLAEVLNGLGPKGMRALLGDAVGQRMHVSRDPAIATAVKRIWEHGVAVGTLARDVLALSGQPDSEAAYLAGLLHDAGKVIVASVLLEAERQTTEIYDRPWIGGEQWVEVVQLCHRPVGIALAEKWQLPDQVVKCMQADLDYDNGDRTSLANAVCFANALAKKSGVYVGAIDAEDVDAIVMIGRSIIGVNDDILKTLLKGVKERVNGLFD
jgi:putative nucleotidyltransferase with HDIG domain